ncbi:hypothetical protein JD974_12415 [Chromobacterium haemolyticum]|uniref:Uncharacterized protein n=2 Tax=Chromobacterium haemolyticum TaxID=394935 RepID=A0ABS3GNE0_9NEIS|nr:DUF6173 family protein [Chromobacterium haemolyticum]MBK0415209.1 hypothetical protein [Chromobacterium haemolyticum]MBO0416576.1 hypothetical protein [Chromobacterium haemolyticum]
MFSNSPGMPPPYPLPAVRSIPEAAFDTLVSQITCFEKETSNSEVVGALLASFGQAVTIQLKSLSRDGQFICMVGFTDDGSEATLIQHYSQVSLLLLKMPKPAGFEKQRIGFL